MADQPAADLGVWMRDVTAEKSTVNSEIPQLHFVPGRPVRGAGRVYLGDTGVRTRQDGSGDPMKAMTLTRFGLGHVEVSRDR